MQADLTGAGEESAIETAVRRERLAGVLRSQKSGALTNIAAAFVAALIAGAVAPAGFAISWFAVAAGHNGLRIGVASAMARRARDDKSSNRSLRLLAAMAFISGCVWAALPVFTGAAYAASSMLIAIIIVGVTAGAAIHARGSAAIATLYIVPPLLAVMAKLSLTGDWRLILLSAAVAHHCYFLVRTSIDSERLFVRASRDKLEAIAAQEAARLYKTAMEHAPFGMFIATPDANIIDANQALCRMLDCSKAELLTDGIGRFTHPEDLLATLDFYRDMAQGRTGVCSQETRSVKANGDVLWTHNRIYVLRDPDSGKPAYVIGQIEDIQARKDAERAIENALTEKRLAMQLAGLGEARWRLKSGRIDVSEEFARIFGLEEGRRDYTLEEWEAAVHPEDRAREMKGLDKRLENREREKKDVALAYRIIRPDGDIRHLKVRSHHFAEGHSASCDILAVVLDVTDQVRTLEALKAKSATLSEALIRSDLAMDVAGLGVTFYDSDSGIWNRDARVCEISGLPPVSRSAGGWLDIVHADDRDRMVEEIRNFREARTTRFTQSFRTIHPDGSIRHIRSANAAEYDGTGRFAKITSAILDITGFVELASALEAEKDELCVANEQRRLALEISGLGEYRFDAREKAAVWSDRLYEIFGVTPDAFDCSVKSFLAAIHAEDRPRVEESRERRFQSPVKHDTGHAEMYQERFRILRPSGEIRHLHNIAYPYRGANGENGAVIVGLIRDETDEVLHLKELHEAKELAQVTISSAGEGFVRTDEKGQITLCNPVAASFLGEGADALFGRPFADMFRFMSGAGDTAIENPLAGALERSETVRLNSTLKLKCANGVSRPVNLSVTPMLREDGMVFGAIAVIQDASKVAMLTDRLKHQAYTDALTGLNNRRAFEERLAEYERRSLRRDEPLEGRRRGRDYLLFVDLDHFKIVNDVCGHDVGDQLLRDVAGIFRRQLREDDFIARFGGDEFGVIIGGDETNACHAAQRIIDEIAAYRINHDKQTFQIGASIGITAISDGSDAATLMKEADTACYTAKNIGRGRFYIFHENDAAIVETWKTHSWYQRIQRGLEEKRFQVYLQKIVSKDRETVGYEALLRLTEDGKTFGPGAFLSMARRSQLLPKLDRFMFESVVALLRGEHAGGDALRDKYVSINMSASSVSDPAFREWLDAALAECGPITERLWLELTESDRMKWTEDETAFLRAVRDRGVRLYFDDFGTGYNSFDILKRAKVDGLKLDHSVIRNITSSPIDQALVGAALGISRNLDLDIVAEGVENETAFKFLCSLGVKKFQGYLFHRPENAAKLLKTKNAGRKKAG